MLGHQLPFLLWVFRLPLSNDERLPGQGGACLEITMSTFAVFGMTASAALADARKKTKTTKPSGKAGGAPPRAFARRME